MFQPDPERPGPRLVGYALEGKRYRELGPDPALSPGAGSVRSEALGVSFRPEGAFLRVRDLRSGKDYRWSLEWGERLEGETAARRQADERADREAEARAREAEARRRAEARIAALEARLARGGQ